MDGLKLVINNGQLDERVHVIFGEVPVAECGYVRVAGDSSKQRSFCRGTELVLNIAPGARMLGTPYHA